MAHKTETFTRTITETRVVRGSRTCDRCGAPVDEEVCGDDRRRFVVEFTHGSSWSDGGYEHGWRVGDTCDACVEVLKDAIEAAGFKTEDLDRDW